MTRLSNGSMAIEDLIVLAQKRGVTTISITDHDCLAGTMRGRVIGAKYKIEVIPGAEFSTTDPDTGENVNVLAYMFDPAKQDRLEGICHRNSLARKKAGQYMKIKTTKKMGISNDLVTRCATGSTNLYPQHIMHALMECGLTSTIYGELFDRLFSPDSAENVLEPVSFEDTRAVIDGIHDAEGFAVIAHPHVYSPEQLDKYVSWGADGVEVWYPQADESVSERLLSYAREKDILAVGGSDFHGMYNRGPWSVGDFVTPDEELAAMFERKNKIKKAK